MTESFRIDIPCKSLSFTSKSDTRNRFLARFNRLSPIDRHTWRPELLNFLQKVVAYFSAQAHQVVETEVPLVPTTLHCDRFILHNELVGVMQDRTSPGTLPDLDVSPPRGRELHKT